MRLTSSSKSFPQLWHTASRIFLTLLMKPGHVIVSLTFSNLFATLRHRLRLRLTNVEDGGGQFDVPEMAHALVHVAVACRALGAAVGGA